MSTAPPGLSIGPLGSTLEVVAFIVLSGMAWFNGAELLLTIFLTFKRWTGKYFYCLIVASCGVLIYQINVFLMIFGTHINSYANIFAIGIGWSCMVTGQSLVLWSRLHLVIRTQWKLRVLLAMIITNGVCLHGPQLVFSMLAIKDGHIDPTYKPFAVMEKISVAILTSQEIIISMVYLAAAVRILRMGETFDRKGNRHRIKLLFLSNLLIIALDVCTITLEFLALWGIWCSFKGFGYSVKLKIEFAILNQLRDSVKGTLDHDRYGSSSRGTALSRKEELPSTKSTGQLGRLSMKRSTFQEIPGDNGQIEKKTEIDIKHTELVHQAGMKDVELQEMSLNQDTKPPSEVSSEIDFANRGV